MGFISKYSKEEIEEILDNVKTTPLSVIKWTNNDIINNVILSIEYQINGENKPSPDLSSITFKLDFGYTVNGGNLFFIQLHAYEGANTSGYNVLKLVKNGYNKISLNQLGINGDLIIVFDFGTYYPKSVYGVNFKINSDLINGQETAVGYFQELSNKSNEKTDSINNELNFLLDLFMTQSNNGLIYKNINNNQPIISTQKLSDNTSLFSYNNNVEKIWKVDCSGISNFNSLFGGADGKGGDEYTGRKNLNIETATLYNFTPSSGGMTHLCYHMQKLKDIKFNNTSNTSNVTSLTCAFSDTGIETLDLSKLDFSRVNNCKWAFNGNSNTNLIKLPVNNMGTISGSINFSAAFTDYAGHTLDLNLNENVKINNTSDMFINCMALEDLTIGGNFKGVTSTSNMFYYAFNIINFSGLNNIDKSYSLNHCFCLTKESALNCINKLYDLTVGGTVTNYTPQTLTFQAGVKSKLTTSDIAIATAKGWNIA